MVCSVYLLFPVHEVPLESAETPRAQQNLCAMALLSPCVQCHILSCAWDCFVFFKRNCCSNHHDLSALINAC